jgi:hypothetical protein
LCQPPNKPFAAANVSTTNLSLNYDAAYDRAPEHGNAQQFMGGSASPKTNYSVDCKCGATNCRKILTGKDWQRADLQTRYAGYFSTYLARKIVVLDNEC